jgi:sigma-B regulation protein RsbU (phosphoserine phosphatase)
MMIGIPQRHHYDFLSSTDSQEWEMAREVQNRSFPSAHPRIAGLDYYSDWRPAEGLCRDCLDYFELPEGNLGLAIGDVAGQGLAAALLTSSLHGLARALRHGYGSLAELTAAIDGLFYEVCPDSSYASMFLARYDPERRLLHYVNAGHEPPIVLRKTDRGYWPVELEPTGPVIGMLRKSAFEEGVISLLPGDMLIAYTDGLCEAVNTRGEAWGFERLLSTIRASSYRKARDIVDRVLETVESFSAGGLRYDDMTLWLGRVEETARETLPSEDHAALAAVA